MKSTLALSIALASLALAQNAASFLTTDTATQGNWPNVYGGSGYQVVASAALVAIGATVTPAGQSSFTWMESTQDPRALRKAPSTQDRISATWYAPVQFSIGLQLTGQFKVAIYCLDWDSTVRVQTVVVMDGDTGVVLDRQVVRDFHNGVYLAWKMSGKVRIEVTSNAGANAVVQGIFLDAIPPPPVTMTAVANPSVVAPGGQTTLTIRMVWTGAIAAHQWRLGFSMPPNWVMGMPTASTPLVQCAIDSCVALGLNEKSYTVPLTAGAGTGTQIITVGAEASTAGADKVPIDPVPVSVVVQ